MSHAYRATVSWRLPEDEDFTSRRYSRAHDWRFDGGITVPASSSPSIVPLPWSRADAVDPEEAFVAALSFLVYVGMMIVSYVVFMFAVPGAGRRAALSAGFISGTRNLAIILAVLPVSVDPDLPLFFAVGQFPIYIMPIILKPVFRRLLDRRTE